MSQPFRLNKEGLINRNKKISFTFNGKKLFGYEGDTIAQDQVHELNSELRLNRFSTGHLLDEKGLGTKTWIG